MSFLALMATAGVACDDDDDDGVSPEIPDQFTATLTGGAERPNPVTTTATGTATFTVNAARTQITYTVRAANLATGGGQQITACHIHAGSTSAAGPVIVTLCTPNQPGVTAEAEIASGTIAEGTDASTKGSSPIGIDALLLLLVSGDAYVNVHTTANAGGEIRGQIQGVP
jgi:hypothetical protein